MDKMLMAKILYYLSIDMDYMDYVEQWETEIDCLFKELTSLEKTLTSNPLPCLMQVLENICISTEEEAEKFYKDHSIH